MRDRRKSAASYGSVQEAMEKKYHYIRNVISDGYVNMTDDFIISETAKYTLYELFDGRTDSLTFWSDSIIWEACKAVSIPIYRAKYMLEAGAYDNYGNQIVSSEEWDEIYDEACSFAGDSSRAILSEVKDIVLGFVNNVKADIEML